LVFKFILLIQFIFETQIEPIYKVCLIFTFFKKSKKFYFSNPINIKEMQNLTQDQWKEGKEKDDNVVILDVRTEEEFMAGFIPEAINIDIYKGQEFLVEIEKLDKSKSYYVYCRSGARSASACSLMHQHGIENAYNLMGGITQWDGEIQTP
jgi:rhodanese-related sulfurtransferase